MNSQRALSGRSATLIGVILTTVIATASGVQAQALKDVQMPDTPLVLKAQGSFFVGGDKAEQTRVELGDLGPGGHITVNQMYVRYMVPQGGDGNVPVVIVHFRFGAKPGAPYADSQFPVTAVEELSKQGVPDVSFGGIPQPNPTHKALSDLANQLNGAVLIGHSQSGAFHLAAALLNPAVARGNLADTPARFITTVTPGGIEEFFRDRSELLKTIKPGDPDYDARYRVILEQHKDRIAIIGPWDMKNP